MDARGQILFFACLYKPAPGTPASDGARRQAPSGGQSPHGRMSAPEPNNRNSSGTQNRRPSGEEAAGNGRSRPSEQGNNQRGRNPMGSPPPNQRNSPQLRRSHQQQSPQRRVPADQQRRQMQPRSKSVPQIDKAARSALALAAVAQAANASNRSPAEAAGIAKAQQQYMARKQQVNRRGAPQQQPLSPQPRKIQPVNLESVKGLLRSEVASKEEENSELLEKITDGGNDSFMRHLLLFEHLRAEEDDGQDLNQSLSQMEDMKTENMDIVCLRSASTATQQS